MFGSPTLFGQGSNPSSSNSLSSTQFGCATSFGSTTDDRISTGVFGVASSPSSYSSTFRAPSFPAFRSSTPALGASSTPVFGHSSSRSAGSYTPGQEPAFAGFGSTSTFGQSTVEFDGSNFVGINPSPFGTQSFPSGSLVTTPTCGSRDFGPSTFGRQHGGSRVTSYTGTAEADGGISAQSAGRLASISAMPVYKDKNHEELRHEDYQFGDKGSQVTIPPLGNTGFGAWDFGRQHGGSRIAFYTETGEIDGRLSSQPAGRMLSISSMPVYLDKSHEELRWEDYQYGDKGGLGPASQSAGGIGNDTSNIWSNPFSPSQTSGHSSLTNLSSSIPSNPFGPKIPAFSFLNSGFSTSAFSSPTFSTSSSGNTFWITSPCTSSSVTASAPAFGPNSSPSLFGPSSSPSFASSPSILGSTSPASDIFSINHFSSSINSNAFAPQTPAFSFPGSAVSTTVFSSPTSSSGNPFWMNYSPSLFFASSTPALAPSLSIYSSSSAPGTPFVCGPNIFGSTSPVFASSPSIFNSPCTCKGPNSSPSLFSPNRSPFSASSHSIFGSPCTCRGPNSSPSLFSPNRSPFSASSHSIFGSPCTCRGPNSSPSLFGPNRLPFSAPSPSIFSSLFPASGQTTTPVSTPSTPAQTAQTGGKITVEVSAPVLNGSTYQHKDGNLGENNMGKGSPSSAEQQEPNWVHDNDSTQKRESRITFPGLRVGKAAIAYEHGPDVLALMPKLRCSGYYTEPGIQELAARETAEPGFCRHVKNFVVGRHGYGRIKFLGETDVRHLDLESLVQFNNREVILYMDVSKKPQVGQGLNKPAEVTLLNIKCIDRKTGKQLVDGPMVDKYKEILIKKAADQGAEFVSYDPVEGEWKFSVQHFM